jgi:hypothetical protein
VSSQPKIMHSGGNNCPQCRLSRILHRQSRGTQRRRPPGRDPGVRYSVSQTCSLAKPYVLRSGSRCDMALAALRGKPQTLYMNRLIAVRARTREAGLCYVSEDMFIFALGRTSRSARALQSPQVCPERALESPRGAGAPPYTPYGTWQAVYDVPCAGGHGAERGLRGCIWRWWIGRSSCSMGWW